MVCLLNDLEDAELVVRRRDRADRRRAIVQLSDEGERTLREVDRAVEVVEQEMLTGLDAAERWTLQRLLSRLQFGVGEWMTDGRRLTGGSRGQARRQRSQHRHDPARVGDARVDRGLAHGGGDGLVHVAVKYLRDQLGLDRQSRPAPTRRRASSPC